MALRAEGCAACHVRSASASHDAPCESCHRPDDAAARRPGSADHPPVLANPSAPEHVRAACGACHGPDIERLDRSLHMTMAGIVNQTRYLFGAQDAATPPRFGAAGALPGLPAAREGLDRSRPVRAIPAAPLGPRSPVTPADLVDDALAERCLACHLGRAGSGRSAGCAACHDLHGAMGPAPAAVVDAPPGRAAVNGRTPFSSLADGLVAPARPSGPPRDAACLACHRGNATGADYHGFFERDQGEAFASAVTAGRPVPTLHGRATHRLAPDLHQKAGLWCVDCHDKADVMGRGHLEGFAAETTSVACRDCHGGFGPSGRDRPDVLSATPQGGWRLKSGRTAAPPPRFDPATLSHDATAHGRLRCSACHALWSFQDHGPSLARRDDGDFSAFDLPDQQGPSGQPGPSNQVGPSGQPDPPGRWRLVWRLRRFEYLPLGLDHRDRVAVIRPRGQYAVSYVDASGRTLLDEARPERGDGSGRGWAWNPTEPHTTQAVGRPCHDCHGDPVAAGLGLEGGRTPDTALTVPDDPPAVPGAHGFSAMERARLMIPSDRVRLGMYQALRPLLELR